MTARQEFSAKVEEHVKVNGLQRSDAVRQILRDHPNLIARMEDEDKREKA